MYSIITHLIVLTEFLIVSHTLGSYFSIIIVLLLNVQLSILLNKKGQESWENLLSVLCNCYLLYLTSCMSVVKDCK